MSYNCYKCGTEVEVLQGGAVSRRDECSKCKADLHCCRNCKFYDLTAYNECREPEAERVVEKDKPNYCDYFEFKQTTTGGTVVDKKQEAFKALDDLFKR